MAATGKALLKDLGAGQFALQGELNFHSVAQLWADSAELFARQMPVLIDLSAVTRSDSSGVALLIAWFSQAKMQQQVLHFVHMPTQMQAMAQVVELQQVLLHYAKQDKGLMNDD